MDELKPVKSKREPSYPPRRLGRRLRRGLIAAGAVALALGALGVAAAASRTAGVPVEPIDEVRMPGEAPAPLHVEHKPWEPDFAWVVSEWQRLGGWKPQPAVYPDPVRLAGDVAAPELP